jgi:hypothetical protein
MSVGTQFELFPSPTFPGVTAAFSPVVSVPFMPALSGSSVLTTALFSGHSALVQKAAHLIENERETQIRKPFNFNRFRTLSHSFPASPSLSICSPNQPGVYPARPKIDKSCNSIIFSKIQIACAYFSWKSNVHIILQIGYRGCICTPFSGRLFFGGRPITKHRHDAPKSNRHQHKKCARERKPRNRAVNSSRAGQSPQHQPAQNPNDRHAAIPCDVIFPARSRPRYVSDQIRARRNQRRFDSQPSSMRREDF